MIVSPEAFPVRRITGLAHFKAETVNAFVREKSVATVIEFGCGDGNQLKLAHYPRYVGVDIAPWAIEHCRLIFKDDSSKQFSLPDNTPARSAELALSLDVIYHLVEDDVFHHYMEKLCDSASRYIIIYSSNTETYNYKFQDPHVRHRCFSDWIKQHRPQWKLLRHLPHPFPYKPEDAQNTSLSEFFFYEKKA
ncbi:MAG: methyltransferase domain-containing protein [Proteobacteria bacterium]|nr:methyltransferase domain-containing protein [Pseudomonadota bacterium]